MKNIRNLPSDKVQDPSSISNLTYSNTAGANKNTEVGRHLLPIPVVTAGVLSYKTNVTVATVLPCKGRNLAVYNNAGAVGSITLGEDATITALAAGVADATGHVGIACPPNDWTYIACGEQNWVIGTAATLLCYLIDDDTSVKQESVR